MEYRELVEWLGKIDTKLPTDGSKFITIDSLWRLIQSGNIIIDIGPNGPPDPGIGPNGPPDPGLKK